MAEEFFNRLRRAEIGHHHHIAGTYLLRYAPDTDALKANPRSKDRLERLKDGKIKQLAFGRPSSMTPAKDREARALLGQGVGVLKIAKQLGVGTGTIQKIKGELQTA